MNSCCVVLFCVVLFCFVLFSPCPPAARDTNETWPGRPDPQLSVMSLGAM